jgi:tetratricopeptide (TPR) repeat protein
LGQVEGAAQQDIIEFQRRSQSATLNKSGIDEDVEASAAGAQVVTQPPSAEVETRPEEPAVEPIAAPEAGEEEMPTSEGAPRERFYSAGRRAEPRLWSLLNAGQYTKLELEIESLRRRDPNWRPPEELIHWLRHHLTEQAKAANEAEKRARERVAERASARSAPVPYRGATKQAARLQRQERPNEALAVLEPWLPRIEERRDASTMALLGWLRFNVGDKRAALQAFEQSNRWHPTAEAAKGELLALADLDDPDELMTLSEAYAQRWPQLRPVAAASLRSMGNRLHGEGEYQQAQRVLVAAETLAPAGRDTRLLTGWNLLQLDEPRAAADVFMELYREQPDADSAEGLLISLRRLDDDSELERLAKEPGPLRELWLEDQAERLTARGDFVRAYRIDPDASPALANIDSPAIGVGIRLRERSGDPGLGRLTETQIPVLHLSAWSGEFEFSVSVDRVSLDAGTPGADALIGSAANLSTDAVRSSDGSSNVDGGLSWLIGVAYQGDWHLAAEIGQTPTNGALGPKTQGAVTIGRKGEDYAWYGTLAHEPMRESLLSYTGLNDPWSDRAWGRVFRSGLSLDGWYQLNDDWTLAAVLRVHEYTGTDVANNTGIEAGLSVGRNLRRSEFAYLTLGPAIEYRHFRRNLNHFTIGHGGYYSPERDLGLMLALDFQTREAAPWMVQGSARAGWRSQDQAESPLFPIGPPAGQTDMFSYEATSESGLAAYLRIQGVARLSARWQVGAGLYGNYNRSYEEYSGLLFLRWFFQPRAAVFSSDLPGFIVDDLM